jgi:mono/diheme cytochrome c family protein
MRPLRVLIPILIAGAALAMLLGSLIRPSGRPVTLAGTQVGPLPTLAVQRLARGAELYLQYCSTCHGVALEGAPDWKQAAPDGSYPAPPHDSTGHTWHHGDAVLLNIIANGGDPAYNSKMPAFEDSLSTDEMLDILEFIKASWELEQRQAQWWMTAQGR